MFLFLVAIAVNEDGFREVFGSRRGHEGGQGQLGQFLPVALRTRLDGVKLIVSPHYAHSADVGCDKNCVEKVDEHAADHWEWQKYATREGRYFFLLTFNNRVRGRPHGKNR